MKEFTVAGQLEPSAFPRHPSTNSSDTYCDEGTKVGSCRGEMRRMLMGHAQRLITVW